MKAVINFKRGSPYEDESQMVVENLTEVHYNYPSAVGFKSVAFESDIDGTGFTIRTDWIEDFEITP